MRYQLMNVDKFFIKFFDDLFLRSAVHLPSPSEIVNWCKATDKAEIRGPDRLTLTRVARWYIFKPKIHIWLNFGGSSNARCWYILWPLGLFYGPLVYFVTIWYILLLFGTFFPVLVCCTNKNLATLAQTPVLLYEALLHNLTQCKRAHLLKLIIMARYKKCRRLIFFLRKISPQIKIFSFVGW
jgi:hypothetical protein